MPVLVVVPFRNDFAVFLAAPGVVIVPNEFASDGTLTPIATGIPQRFESIVPGVVMMTRHQVALYTAHRRSLCSSCESTSASGYAGHVGVQAHFAN